MRRLSFVLLTALVAVSISCQTKTIVGSTITVAWDAPVLGTIPVAQISYEVVMQPYPTGTQVLVATVVKEVQAATKESGGNGHGKVDALARRTR